MTISLKSLHCRADSRQRHRVWHGLQKLVFIGVICFCASRIFAANYFVATNGLDTTAGTLAAPFRTIQKAANVMVAGDTCYVRAGTYRENVIPVNSGNSGLPITFQNYSNETAVISGAEVLSGWTLDSGTTYKTAMTTNFLVSPYNQSDQVFVDGSMMTLAKWPNTTVAASAYPSGSAPAVDVSHPAKSVITSFVSKNTAGNVTTGVVTDTALPAQAAGFYEGAQIFFQPNNGAWSWTFSGTVTGVSGNQITFTTYNSNGQDGNNAVYAVGSRYYLFNKKEFLDAPGEWWHDPVNGQLYAIMPDSGNPTNHSVEARKRDFAFDLSNKSYITVKGFYLFACTITTDTAAGGSGQGYDAGGNVIYPWRGAGSVAAANHIIIDGINAKYLSHFTDVSGHFYQQWGQGSGIILSGGDCVLKNSTLQFSAGNGVTVLGQRNKVLSNFIYDTAYGGTDCAFIHTGGAATSVDHEIATNTCSRTGRSGITPRALQNSNVGGGQFIARIHHNDIGQFGIQDWDVGALYTSGDGKFTRVDHNQFHDASGYTCSGVYLDFSKNYILDHNVAWGVEWGIHFQAQDSGTSMANHICYNNTVAVKNTSSSPYGPFGLVNNQNPGNNTGSVLLNNIVFCQNKANSPGYAGISSFGWTGATFGTNLQWDAVANSTTDPKFVDAANFNFQLLANSPARGSGVAVASYVRDGITVPPFSDNPAGNRDLGAFEYFNSVLLQSASLSIYQGNTNSWIDSGEVVQEKIVLNNQTAANLTNLSATLTAANPDVIFITDTSAFPSVAVSALGTNITPFAYRLANNVPPGTTMNFTLIASANGNFYTNTFAHTVGLPLLAYSTNVFFSTNVPKAIPDYANSTAGHAYSTNVIGSAVVIDKITVGVRIDHTFDYDLIISLLHPDNTEITLSSQNGGNGDNYGSTVGSTTNFTVFDDAAATAIASGSAPFVGSYKPTSPLSGFAGKSANGPWRLHVSDNARTDVGTILAWYLTVVSHTTNNQTTTFFAPPAMNAQIAALNGDLLSLKFFGLPGDRYALQAATNIAGPWSPVATNQADINGEWLFTVTNSADNQWFYRATPR